MKKKKQERLHKDYFSMLNNKFKPHHSRTVLSLQSLILKRAMNLPKSACADCKQRQQTVTIINMRGD